jgi:hypothetical protein
MNAEKTVLPLAMTVSSGSSGVSAPFSVLQEQTGALGQAMLQLFAVPAANQQGASEALTARIENMAHSIEQVYQGANNSVQFVNLAVVDAARRNVEQTLQFCQDLAGASGPAEALRVQLAFLQSQAVLFAQQVTALQREMFRLLSY